MFDSGDGNVALLGVDGVPADGANLTIGADQVLYVAYRLGEAQVVKVKHIFHQIELKQLKFKFKRPSKTEIDP